MTTLHRPRSAASRELGASFAFIERNFNLSRRYWGWELAFLVYAIAGALAISFIGAEQADKRLIFSLVIGAIFWNYLSTVFSFIAETISWERWEGTLEYTMMAPVRRASQLLGSTAYALLYGLIHTTVVLVVLTLFFELDLSKADFLTATGIMVVGSFSVIGIGVMAAILPLLYVERGAQMTFVIQCLPPRGEWRLLLGGGPAGLDAGAVEALAGDLHPGRRTPRASRRGDPGGRLARHLAARPDGRSADPRRSLALRARRAVREAHRQAQAGRVTGMTTTEPPRSGVGAETPAITPFVPGLLLRPVRWPEEASILNDINNAGRIATGNLEVLSVEGLLNYYTHLVNCDLATDLRLAEHDGRPVAYVRVEWQDEMRGGRTHVQGLITGPEAPAGTFEAILDWGEARSRAIAETLAADGPASLGAFLNEESAAHIAILESRGYRAARLFFGMVRPTLDDVPEPPLPAGVEVRPVLPEHLRAIWEAEVAAFRGHWGASAGDASEDRWEQFRHEPLNDLALWQVAWAGDAVVGMVRPYINPGDLAVLGVRRGWCENISTHAAWRGRGIATALIARALVALRERGMTEAALGVDAENETGALGLYRSMGFAERTRETDFRRPLEPGGLP